MHPSESQVIVSNFLVWSGTWGVGVGTPIRTDTLGIFDLQITMTLVPANDYIAIVLCRVYESVF